MSGRVKIITYWFIYYTNINLTPFQHKTQHQLQKNIFLQPEFLFARIAGDKTALTRSVVFIITEGVELHP